MAQQQGVKLKDPQILRIFVSSPFNGMENERDCLSKLYWPRLKSVLVSKGLLLRVVDLRWGITAEMSSDHQTITTCLREIDRSDIFVGLYGQRYGWCGKDDEALQKNFDKALDRFKWVDEYRDRSITELEFLQGHLNEPGRTPSCFCFRDAKYDAKQSAAGAAQGDAKKERNYRCESDDAARRLVDLRQRVGATEAATMGVNMDYDTPEDGAEFIYKCIRKYIDDVIFAHQEPLSKWEKSEQAHNIFMHSRRGIYIGGERYAEQLDRFVTQDGSTVPLVITGPTGCGKTALLSHWLHNRRDAETNDIVVSHFVGADPKSTKPGNIVKRIMGNIDQLHGREPDKDFEIQLNPEDLMTKLHTSLLEMENQKEPIRQLIIIIDRIDEVNMKKTFKTLYWLPNSLPANVRMILTVTTGSELANEALENLTKEHSAEVMEIGGLRTDSKRALCDQLLKQYSKSMETEQFEMILNSPKTNQPFFLRILIPELCIHGKFRTLTAQIQEFLDCKDVVELIGFILTRIGEEYNRTDYDGDLVKDVLCAIVLCKRGISEMEFPMPQHMWTPLIYAMEKYLINRSGLLSFSFPEMKMAVERRYMPDSESKREAAKRVSKIFYEPFAECIRKRLPIQKRIAIELPHLLAMAGDHSRLLEVVSNIKVFEMLYTSTPFIINDYWQELGLPGDTIARRYLRSLDNYVASRYATHMKNMSESAVERLITWKANILPVIRTWMQQSRLYTGMEIIFDREISLFSRIVGKSGVEQMKAMVDVKFEKASFLANTGRYREAEKLHQEVLGDSEKLAEKGVIKMEELAKSYNALGRCCYKLHRSEQSEDWYMLAMKTIKDKPSERVHLAWVFYNLGMNNYDQEDHKASLEWFNKAIDLWQEIEPHKQSLGQAVNFLHIGSVYLKQGELDKAEEYYQKALSVNKSLLGKDSIDVAKCLSSLSELEHKKKNHMKSLALVQKSVKIFQMMAPEGYHRTALAQELMAKQFIELGKFEEAETIVDTLINHIHHHKIRTQHIDLYLSYIEKFMESGNFLKVVEVCRKLLGTQNESDVIVAHLLKAYSCLPEAKDVTNDYLVKVAYGLSKWPLSEDILRIHISVLKQKDIAQILPFIQKHCEAQPNSAEVGSCYYMVCNILQDMQDVKLAKCSLDLGLKFNAEDKSLASLSLRLQPTQA